MPQAGLPDMLKFWEVPPWIGPLPPYCGRVSTARQGWASGTNCKGLGGMPLITEVVASKLLGT